MLLSIVVTGDYEIAVKFDKIEATWCLRVNDQEMELTAGEMRCLFDMLESVSTEKEYG